MKYNSEEIIKLNVGGTIFETKMTTLSETNIIRLLEKSQNKKKDHFIDRDPTLFKYILDFLRGYSLYLSDDSPLASIYMQKSLLEEAKFYQIPDLEQALTLRLSNPKLHVKLWENLELSRQKYEDIRKKMSSTPPYPEDLDLKFHSTNIPSPTVDQIQNQINILESQIQAYQNQTQSQTQSQTKSPSKTKSQTKTKSPSQSTSQNKNSIEAEIEAKIEETKKFLLESVKNLQTLAPNSPFTQNLQEDIEQFYRENRNVFRNLDSSPQEIPKLINQLLHFIWAKGLEQTPEGQDDGKTQSPFDVLFQLVSNLTQSESQNQSQNASGTREEPTS